MIITRSTVLERIEQMTADATAVAAQINGLAQAHGEQSARLAQINNGITAANGLFEVLTTPMEDGPPVCEMAPADEDPKE